MSVISGRKEAFKTLEADRKSKLDNGVAVVFGDPDLATFRVFYIDPAVMDAEDGAAGGSEAGEEEEEVRGGLRRRCRWSRARSHRGSCVASRHVMTERLGAGVPIYLGDAARETREGLITGLRV